MFIQGQGPCRGLAAFRLKSSETHHPAQEGLLQGPEGWGAGWAPLWASSLQDRAERLAQREAMSGMEASSPR